MNKHTLRVRAFGWLKIPMIAYLKPRVESIDDAHVVVSIPLRRRSQNHLKSMYFGALSVGADLAAGYLAMQRIDASGERVSFVFKASQAEFLRRPTGRVHFACNDGVLIRDLVDRCIASGEREEETVNVVCTVPKENDEAVATFAMTISLKRR